MGQSLTTQFLGSEHEIPCLRCRYPIWVRYSEIVTQVGITCPCCRALVPLRDDTGSVHNAGAAVEQRIRDALKGLFR
jgi:hypothetical protein